MKKIVLALGLTFALLVGACGQLPFFTPTPPSGPTSDSAATQDALFKTAVAQTLTARATSPSAPATNTAASPVIATTDTATATLASAVASLSATPAAGTITATGEIPTATSLPQGGTVTATLASGQVTPIWTLAIRTYGTLPPAVPFSYVTLINKAKAEAYISLQVTMPDGNYSIIEYPVEGRVRIKAPVGSYLYVAWVGGRKMVGEFRLKHNDDLSITLFKDSVVIK